MSPISTRWCRCLIVGLTILGAIVMAGCFNRGTTRPNIPDETLIEPASQALDKAVDVDADSFAPRMIDSARRRMTLARDILFSAAEADRPLTDEQTSRIKTLAAQARLDARAALIKTQAGAIDTQLDRLQNGANRATSNNQDVLRSNPSMAGTNRQTLGGSQ